MEQHRQGRRRTLRTGLLILNANGSAIECLVREIGSGGAGIWLHTWMALPDRIDLMIPSANLRVGARVAWQRGQEIDLEFLGMSVVSARRPAAQPARIMAA